MKLAEIKDGVVTNIIEVDPASIPDWAAGWPEAQQAGPGWTYDGKAFSPPPEPEPDPVEQPPTPAQLQAAIEAVAKAAGLTDQALDTVMESVGISRTVRTSPAIEGKT